MDWNDEDPGLCDLGQLDGMGSQLTTWIGQLDTIITNSTANRDVITIDVWSGTSTDAWLARFTRVMAPVTTLKLAFEDARAAFQEYRDTVSRIKTNAQQWRDQAFSARSVLNMHYAGNADPSPEEEQLQIEQQAKRVRAQQDLDEALGMLATYGTQREAADNTLVGALNAALPPDWPAQRDALAAVGIDSIAEIANVGNLKDAMVDAANSVIDMDGEFEQSAAALSALLALYAEDEAVLSAFYQELGGEKTVELVNQVGWYGDNDWLAPAAALVLAGGIRSGLSTASTGWTQNQGENFASEMMTHPADRGTEIGYLFNDPNSPLGETLAVAMADAWDQWERVDGNHFVASSPPSGGFWLSMQASGDWGMRVEDPSGPIFSTLGQHPDAAYEWLTSSDGAAIPPDEFGQFAADDRVGYWFDTRYDVDSEGWSANTADHFQGVSELFYGALQANGGPTDPTDLLDTDAANPADMAQLSHDVISAILGNDRFEPANMNGEASVALAGSFLINMPAFTEYPINADAPPNQGDVFENLLPNGNTVYIPMFAPEDLAEFMGLAGSHEGGALALSQGVATYQTTLINTAALHGDDAYLYGALHRVATLQGALDGALTGQMIETAADRDAEINAAIDGIGFVIGTIPLPMVSDALGEGVEAGIKFMMDWGQTVAQSATLTAASDFASGFFANNEATAQALVDAGAADRETYLRYTLAALVTEYYSQGDDVSGTTTLPFDTPPPLDLAGLSAAERADAFSDAEEWYGDHWQDIDIMLAVQNPGDDGLNVLSGDYLARVQSYDDDPDT